MNTAIQPKYQTVTVTCNCGHSFTVGSTKCKNFSIDICSECHPFYTGKQNIVDMAGRVDNFKKRFGTLKPKSL